MKCYCAIVRVRYAGNLSGCPYFFVRKRRYVMKRKIVITLLAIIAVVTCALFLAGCVGNSIDETSIDGIYYEVTSDGKIDSKTYLSLQSGKWEDDYGESGTYKTDGDKIIFFAAFFSETEELCDGILKDYVLTVNDNTFISEKHKHKYGEWSVTAVDGTETRTCFCGVKETRTVEKLEHNFSWEFDEYEHWQVCTICGYETEKSFHLNNERCAICAFARLQYEINSDNNGYTVYGIKGYAYNNVVISKTYKGLPVTSIGSSAFEYCSSLTSITIPDSVTSISKVAFAGCSSLISITIPDSVTKIDFCAFASCSSLTSITIPDSVTSIGLGAFENCSSLASITVKDGNIKYHSAGNCLIKTESKILILGCKNSIIPTDGSVTSISERAFENCSSLTSITIPNSVTSIGSYAFEYCSSLASITIPNSVTSISEGAFAGCSSLTSITIPDSVTSISKLAFLGCSSLTSIQFTGTKAQWCGIEKGSSWNNGTGNFTVHCTDGDLKYGN